MLNAIIKASENFCIHQIAEPHEVNNTISKKRTLIAYIDIETKTADIYRVYLASESNFIQRVAKLFLEEDDSDEETLVDMLLETVNLIVGSAKVIAEEADINPFVISTPNFLKSSIFDLEYDDIKTIKINDDEMIIAIKELNG